MTAHASSTRTGRLASVGMALAMLAAAVVTALAAPPDAAAATYVGEAVPAYVRCNPAYSRLEITPSAVPVPGYSSQTVYYRYWILDRTVNKWVSGWAPSTTGTFTATRSTSPIVVYDATLTEGLTTNVRLVPGHSYAVKTEYWWYTNGSWGSSVMWTQSYERYGYEWDNRTLVYAGQCTI